MKSISTIFFILLNLCYVLTNEIDGNPHTSVLLKPHLLSMVQGHSSSINIIINNKPPHLWNIGFVYLSTSGQILPNNYTKLPVKPLSPINVSARISEYNQSIKLKAIHAGQFSLRLNITDDEGRKYPLELDVRTEVSVMFSHALTLFSKIIGWIYFLAWTISFYPQIYINFKRKSVAGLNFDFLALNLLGFLCYSSFSLSLYYSNVIQTLYRQKTNSYVIPVEPNDVFFCVHAVVITCVTICQCFMYDRGDQQVSKLARFLIAILLVIIVIACILGGAGTISWLKVLYCLSYEKIFISLVKYVPQAYFNCIRKSTVGWSIENIILDCTGGSLSTIQMFLIAKNFDDFQSILGNPTKLLLGLFSVFFDLFFMIQHFILFKNHDGSDNEMLIESVDADITPQSINDLD